jgi:hypothetical protein
MELQIDDNYRIVTDDRNFTLQKISWREKNAETGEPTGKEKWDGIGYYATLPQALEALFRRRILDSKAVGFQEALEAFRAAYDEVEKLCRQLKFRIVPEE